MNLNISNNNFWKIFLIRDYFLLWLSGLTTMLSMQLRIIATGFILYEITGSGLSLGMLGIIQLFFQLPSILYGGVLADFFKRTTIIVITQSIGTIIIFLLFLDFRPLPSLSQFMVNVQLIQNSCYNKVN